MRGMERGLHLLLLLVCHAFSIRVTGPERPPGQNQDMSGSDITSVGRLVNLTLNADDSRNVQLQGAASSEKDDISGKTSHNASPSSLEQLKRALKTYVQPDENGRFQGSASWTYQFLDSIQNIGLISESDAIRELGRQESSGRREPQREAWREEGKRVSKEGNFVDKYRVTEWTPDKFPYTLDKLGILAQHSVVARRLYASRMLVLQGLDELIGGNAFEAVQCIAAALRLDDLPISWPAPLMGPAIRTFEFLANNSRDKGLFADACLVLTHLYLLAPDTQGKALVILRRGQQATPSDETLFYIEGNILNSFGDPNSSIAAFERSIELGNSHKALFVHGHVLHKLGCGVVGNQFSRRAHASFEQYILVAPPEERWVCEAYFHLAILDSYEGSLGTARRHYEKGILAQQERLPCYDAKTSNFRRQAESILSKVRACGKLECRGLGTRMCAGCRKIRYCSEECQKSHWKQHKTDCPDMQRKKIATTDEVD